MVAKFSTKMIHEIWTMLTILSNWVASELYLYSWGSPWAYLEFHRCLWIVFIQEHVFNYFHSLWWQKPQSGWLIFWETSVPLGMSRCCFLCEVLSPSMMMTIKDIVQGYKRLKDEPIYETWLGFRSCYFNAQLMCWLMMYCCNTFKWVLTRWTNEFLINLFSMV